MSWQRNEHLAFFSFFDAFYGGVVRVQIFFSWMKINFCEAEAIMHTFFGPPPLQHNKKSWNCYIVVPLIRTMEMEKHMVHFFARKIKGKKDDVKKDEGSLNSAPMHLVFTHIKGAWEIAPWNEITWWIFLCLLPSSHSFSEGPDRNLLSEHFPKQQHSFFRENRSRT